MRRSNVTLWENLHGKKQFRPVYPHELVVQFLFSNFSREDAHSFKILDHGSGAGRHLLLLAEQGYQAYGADVSVVGNDYVRGLAKERALTVSISEIVADTLPYPDNFFDGIISYAVLYYLTHEQLDRVLPELHRVIKVGGKALFILRSTSDYRFTYATEIENGDYRIESGSEARLQNEKGMIMHFFSLDEILKRFAIFETVQVDEAMTTYHHGEVTNHDYVVIVTK